MIRHPSDFPPVRVLLPAVLLSLFATAAWSPVEARAQAAPLVLEARVGGIVPLGSFAEGSRPAEGVTGGSTFGLDFALSGSSRRTLTLGFSQHRLGCGDAGCGAGGEHVATSLDVGMRVNLVTRGNVIPWVRLAGIAMLVELDGLYGEPPATSERGYGAEAGVGIFVGTFEQLALNPGVRWAGVNTRLPGGDVLRMRYVVIDLGLALSF